MTKKRPCKKYSLAKNSQTIFSLKIFQKHPKSNYGGHPIEGLISYDGTIICTRLRLKLGWNAHNFFNFGFTTFLL
jgi:hypothetical protein